MLAVLSLPISGGDIDNINRSTLATISRDESIPAEVLDACYRLVVEHSTPKACYVKLPVDIAGDNVSIGGSVCHSRALARHLQDATAVYMMSVTIGAGIDRLIASRSAMSTLEGYVVDRIASVHVESVCDYVCSYLNKQCPYLTQRFSPGYGDYDISNQQRLVELLDTSRKIGVAMTSGGMLTPAKSVTAIVGVCNKEQSKIYFCDGCAMGCKNGECIR